MKKINNINDIDGNTIEGRLLLIALGELEALGQKDVIKNLNTTNQALTHLGL